MTNAQRVLPVNATAVARLTRCAIRHLRIRVPGTCLITFIDPRQMRRLNRRFVGHDRVTDVLSFRYDQGDGALTPPRLPAPARSRQAGRTQRLQVIGEILIAPDQARVYAKRHGLSYTEELARYVVHGLCHWLGYEDRTRAQQQAMRRLEDHLLGRCGALA